MSTKPILCGKCGTSSDEVRHMICTWLKGQEPDMVSVTCGRSYDCKIVYADSLPAALAKFEEKVETQK